MLEHVEAGDHIETCRRERRVRRVSYEYFGAGIGARPLRGRLLHFDSIQAPGIALHRAQKTTRAATDIEERTAGLVFRDQLDLILPASGGGAFPRGNDRAV